MGLFDRPARVRVAVYIEAQRAEIQRIANAEDATASQVHRAALAYGLPELRKALQHGLPRRVEASNRRFSECRQRMAAVLAVTGAGDSVPKGRACAVRSIRSAPTWGSAPRPPTY